MSRSNAATIKSIYDVTDSALEFIIFNIGNPTLLLHVYTVLFSEIRKFFTKNERKASEVGIEWYTTDCRTSKLDLQAQLRMATGID